MASSNRNWPSMFKSKPYNTHHHQWQHDVNSSLMSNGCHRPSYTTVPGCEERSPEPKPRWNPKPEQIRILEAIFNSGMVNPPRDEIRRIRAQLQEYGQVGDANVFYWFQNRKSRSKQKLRHLQNSKQQSQTNNQNTSVATTISTAPSSSSSSSEKSSPSTGSNRRLSLTSPNVLDVSNSSTGSVNQTYFQAHNEFLTEPFFFPIQQTGGELGLTQGFGFTELSNVVQVNHQQLGPCTSLLLSEIINHGATKKDQPEDTLNIQPQLNNYTANTVPSILSIAPTPLPTTTVTVASTINPIQVAGVGESDPVVGHGGAARSTVFINDVAFEVAAGPFNVREAFGEDAVLVNSFGQPVLTNEWGVTLQSLNHGAFYYLV